MILYEIKTVGFYRTTKMDEQSIRINYHINTVEKDERWYYLTLRVTR